MKLWLQDSDIDMYSAHYEGISVDAERFIRILENKMFDFSIEKVYIDKLADIVNKYNNKYHGTVKMNLIDVKSSTYIAFGIKNNDKDPKFEIGDRARISKYKNIFGKGYTQNLS